MTEMKIALSIEEAADYTGIGRNTLRDLVKWKKLRKRIVSGCPQNILPESHC